MTFFFLNKTSNQVPSSTFGCHSFLFSIKSNILAFLFCLNFHDADILEKPSQWSCKQAEFWMCLIFFFLVRFKLNIWGWRARILLKKIWIKARCHISWERVMNARALRHWHYFRKGSQLLSLGAPNRGCELRLFVALVGLFQRLLRWCSRGCFVTWFCCRGCL